MTSGGVLGISFEFLQNVDFWINVGVLATTYGVFALGIQLNIGTTGIFNFGQAGFMAVGSYTMGILVVKSGVSFWLALLAGIGVAAVAALLVGLPSLRLRADYFAISTLAFSEIVRYVADNWDGLTGGNLGLFGYSDTWTEASARIDGWLEHLGIEPHFLLPLLLVNLALFLVLAGFVALLVRSPWGRVLNAIREDEDAARALGKNTFVFKLQSLALAAGLAAIAGYMLALNISILSPANFEPILTAYGYVIVILGGLGSYRGVVVGSFFIIFVLEATRYLELPLSDARVAALRFMIVGLVLMALVVFRPQGVFGKREELMLRARG
ncbi:MAG TPA: branched-chain amino acid ABC transporter permease [Gaiella sp.]|uniref:branched-chain amino acid ABC transporter permease n=1 Tax=Gaiella sp. TaxID=2663207 RepID=UPI002D800042|nr:branched-chain amino acid ABC transporter permease [Gaiella sp.]HET9286254.1 branched-chain amino acid ABC transporter permease [Gaiella sp.]